MLDKEEIQCLIDEKLNEYGSTRLMSIIYGIESSIENFDLLKIKRFNRMLNSKYHFENISISEELTLELININLHG